MKMLRIPRTKYTTLSNGKPYTELYFGHLLTHTATSYSNIAWDNSVDYKYLDEVVISDLHTIYIAKIDNPKGHPSTSRDWYKEGKDGYKMIDGRFSTKAIFEGVCEIEFETVGMTHILGRGIDNAKEIKLEYYSTNGEIIDTTFNCDSCGEIETLVTMTYDDEFDCFRCCNPDPVEEDSFFIPLDPTFCEEMYKVRIVITKSDPTLPILIGALCVADEFYFGCVQSGFKIGDKIPAQLSEFPAIQATGIDYANISSSMRGDIRIPIDKVDAHRRVKRKHGGYLNYFLFDELDAVKSGLLLGIATDTEYTFNGANSVNMSFEAIGIEH